MAEFNYSDAPKWYNFITNFDAAKKQFDINYAALINQKEYIKTKHPELSGEYIAMVQRADKYKRDIARLQTLRNGVNTILVLLGRHSAAQNLNGLGVIPAVPVAIGLGAALASLATITVFLKDAFVFSRKINELRRLEAEGHSPQEASRILNNLDSGIFKGFGNTLKWLVIGGVLIFVGAPLVKAIGRR